MERFNGIPMEIFRLVFNYKFVLARLSRRLTGELIVYPFSVVRRRRPQCANIFSSDTAGPIRAKLIGLSHIRVSAHVSTAYRDTKGTSHVRRRYVGIRSSYSSIRSSYSSYAEVLRFFMCALINS